MFLDHFLSNFMRSKTSDKLSVNIDQVYSTSYRFVSSKERKFMINLCDAA